MVQILDPVPSFAQSLGRNLGGGLGAGFSQGMAQSREFAQKMALEKQKNKSLLDIFGDGQGKSAQSSLQGQQFQKLAPQQKAMLALTNPSAFKAYEALEKGYEKEEEKEQLQGRLGETIQEMSSTLLRGNLGFSPKRALTSEGRGDAQYFNSLGVQLESIGKDMVSKGTMSNARFNFLLKNMPSADKTDASNAGALKAWSKELGLPVPTELDELYKTASEEKKEGKKAPAKKQGKVSLSKVKPGTPLTADVVKELMKKTQGDKEKAKQVAKNLGYEVE